MSWQNQINFSRSEYTPENVGNWSIRMKPGLTDTYDRKLREKASVRSTPLPPDCLVIEGEQDPCGLAKRVAQALDAQALVAGIKTMTLTQKGNTIIYSGHVPSQQVLDTIVEITAHVDGTHAVETQQVNVAAL
jgi:hypothetical protein